jgi:preprotein translocase subunit SecF
VIQFIKPGTNFDFVRLKNYALTFSLSLILVSVIVLWIKGGPNYGVDFAGGILVQTAFKEPQTAEKVRQGLAKINLDDATIQTLGAKGENEYLIRAQDKPGVDMANVGPQVQKALEELIGQGKVEVRRVEMVGPKVGADLRDKALMALFVSILIMAVYISGRFESSSMRWIKSSLMAAALGFLYYVTSLTGLGLTTTVILSLVDSLAVMVLLRLSYALGAVVALLHDAIITVGVYTILGREFTLVTVAAVLAIIGYSVNDTIIVFDRIRETMGKARRQGMAKVINRAVNDTLSRTIMTSGVTLLSMLPLLILADGDIHDFALTMTIGIVIGTFSSIYIASPILLFLPEQRMAAARVKAEVAPATSPVEIEANGVAGASPLPAAANNKRKPARKKKKK